MLSLNAGFLRQKGFDVTEASDGEQAWTLAEEGKFDLVLLDVMMPGMSGWEVCKRIKNTASSKGTAVVMLTGIGETLNDMTSSLFAADAWLNKPYDFTELERKLREALVRYDKDMPDGGSAFYLRNDGPPPSLPAEDLGPALKKAGSKKAASKKAAPKKAAPKKAAPAAKKAAPKKAAPAAKKAAPAPKKPAPKKPAPKKPAPKKAAPKKAVPAAKKAAPKKPAPKRR